MPIEFLPLVPKESITRINLNSSDLGIYLYDVKLVANPSPPERSIHFKVGLGGCQTQVFRFLSFSKAKTEYGCRIDSPDFIVEKTVTAGPGKRFVKKIQLIFRSWT